MLLVEPAHGSLGHFNSFEFSAINEFANGKNGLKLGLCSERNVFGHTNVDLQRIQLFPQIRRQKGLVSGYVNLKVMEHLSFELVKFLFELKIVN